MQGNAAAAAPLVARHSAQVSPICAAARQRTRLTTVITIASRLADLPCAASTMMRARMCCR
jgi:hypothetical protein